MHRVYDEKLYRIKIWKRYISDQRIRVALTWFFLASLVLQFFHSFASFRIWSTSLSTNHSSISSNPPKFGWWFSSNWALFKHLWQATRADIWPQSFLAAGMSQEQHITAARIRLTELSCVAKSTPFHNSINWSMRGAKLWFRWCRLGSFGPGIKAIVKIFDGLNLSFRGRLHITLYSAPTLYR